jgi:hypothetical protein
MSKIEVNQISSQCGSTLTIGQSGDTVTLACGATQTGFGRTGTVDWCTTAKTAPFTGVSGKGYFVNTTCGAVTVTLPATPSAGDIISIADYTNTWQTNAVTICRNSSKIGGACANANLSTQGQSITLVYVDATEGWKNVQDSTSNVIGVTYMSATGGTVTTCGDYKIHTFTADATFCVSALSTNPSYNNVDYVVVAGGAGAGAASGGGNNGGGGGAGGYRESYCSTTSGCYTASPLASSTSLPVTATGYPITVGGGGAGATSYPSPGTDGSNSVFSTITSNGGGYGGSSVPNTTGNSGGSGGGSGGGGTSSAAAGNTPPVSPPQGNNGGADDSVASGGGGGATANGANGTAPSTGGNGGAGATTSISGSPTSYSGGGGGGLYGTGGVGGGGPAGNPRVTNCTAGTSGTANTGGGGGSPNTVLSSVPNPSGSGGSGIVMIRYKFQ